MSDTLINALKSEMHYTEKKSPKCADCKFCIEKQHDTVQKEWFSVCRFNSITEIMVKPAARCDLFEKR